jgi:hypothetical protein
MHKATLKVDEVHAAIQHLCVSRIGKPRGNGVTEEKVIGVDPRHPLSF